MFWGLIMEPQRRYTQQVKKGFHISMAALDQSTSSDEPAQVMCGFNGRNYLLCTLKKPDMLQCALDLNFVVGSNVSFATNGQSHVHLTGYLTDDILDTTGEVEEEGEEDIEEISVKTKKRIKHLENGPPNKKAKKGSQVSSSQIKNVGSDSEDTDGIVNILLDKSLPDTDDEDEDESIDEEDGEEEEDEDFEELEEEDEQSSLSEEEVEESKQTKKLSKPKINGVSKQQDMEDKKDVKKKKENQNKKVEKNSQKSEGKTPSKENPTPKRKTLQGGVIIEDLREGNGTPAKNGKFVNVFYEARLKQSNKVFDSTTKGNGFSFRLGSGEVIKGWEVGVIGMKSGGKRRITCPPHMAYGQKGSPPVIPPNSTVVFDVELKKVS